VARAGADERAEAGQGEDQIVEVRISAPDAAVAQALASGLVERRLAACAQVLGPISSTYWWEGAVETAQEHLVLAKTTAGRFEDIREHVRSEHPYDNPEILAVPVTAAAGPYAAWLRDVLAARDD
jgi:periplasmic divalent cation tolerance protein